MCVLRGWSAGDGRPAAAGGSDAAGVGAAVGRHAVGPVRNRPLLQTQVDGRFLPSGPGEPSRKLANAASCLVVQFDTGTLGYYLC